MQVLWTQSGRAAISMMQAADLRYRNHLAVLRAINLAFHGCACSATLDPYSVVGIEVSNGLGYGAAISGEWG